MPGEHHQNLNNFVERGQAAQDAANQLITEAEQKVRQALQQSGEMQRVIDVVIAERKRQDAKWGVQNHDPITWVAILGEEFGELSQAALETRFGGDAGGHDNMRSEAIQLAAVAIAFVECLDRNRAGEGKP